MLVFELGGLGIAGKKEVVVKRGGCIGLEKRQNPKSVSNLLVWVGCPNGEILALLSASIFYHEYNCY